MRGCLWFVLSLVAAGWCLHAHAGSATIHRCVASDGTPVYTDQPCNSVGATLISRTTGATGTSAPPAAGEARARSAPRGPLPCPADVDALKRRIVQAFHSHDPNALAGLMLWHGWRSHGAVAQVRDLRSLIRRPLLGFAGDRRAGIARAGPAFAGLPPLAPPSPPPAANAITLELGDIDGVDTQQVSFALAPREGCVWLQP